MKSKAAKALSNAERLVRVAVMCLPTLVAVSAIAAAGPSGSTAAGLPSGEVRVEILEGVPDQLSWDFTPPAPTDTYSEPAFGFVVTPAK